MSSKKCLYDNSKECPVLKAAPHLHEIDILEKACPRCPIHAELMKGKGSYGEM